LIGIQGFTLFRLDLSLGHLPWLWTDRSCTAFVIIGSKTTTVTTRQIPMAPITVATKIPRSAEDFPFFFPRRTPLDPASFEFRVITCIQ
jgi:hypothetical protein